MSLDPFYGLHSGLRKHFGGHGYWHVGDYHVFRTPDSDKYQTVRLTKDENGRTQLHVPSIYDLQRSAPSAVKDLIPNIEELTPATLRTVLSRMPKPHVLTFRGDTEAAPLYNDLLAEHGFEEDPENPIGLAPNFKKFHKKFRPAVFGNNRPSPSRIRQEDPKPNYHPQQFWRLYQ